MSEVGDAIRKPYDTDPDRDAYEGIALQVDDLWERMQQIRRNVADPNALLREIVYVGGDAERPLTSWSAAGKLLPHRGDAVAEWLKGYRDGLVQGTTAWYAVDDLLDEYRLRADLGLTLAEELAIGDAS